MIASNLESAPGVIFGFDPSTNVIESRSVSSLPAEESLSVLSLLPRPVPRLELARKQLSNTKAAKRDTREREIGVEQKKMGM